MKNLIGASKAQAQPGEPGAKYGAGNFTEGTTGLLGTALLRKGATGWSSCKY